MTIFVSLTFILLMTGIWGLFAPSDNFMKLFIPVIDIISIITFLVDYKKIRSNFKRVLLIFLFCIVINILGVWALRGQSIISSLRGTDLLNLLSIYSIFIWHKLKLSENNAKKILIYLMWIFIFCYLLQWFIFPYPLFYVEGDGALDSFLSSGGIRFRLQAQGIAFLSFFYSIYKIIKHGEWKDYFLMILSGAVIIMFEFRSQLIILPFIFILQLVYYSKYRRKRVFWSFFSIIIIGMLLMQSDFVADKIETLQSRNETQNFSNDDYIRFFTYDYYTKEVPLNFYEKIFGTGLDGIDGEYKEETSKAKEIGYIWGDWGLIGLSWKLGIPGVLCLIIYSLKAYKISRKTPDMHYIGLWFLFLVITGTFNREFYRYGIFAIQGFALYILDLKVKGKYNIVKNENRNFDIS